MKKGIIVIMLLTLLTQELYIIKDIQDNRKEEVKTAYSQSIIETRNISTEDSSFLTTKDGLEINSTDFKILCKISSAEAGRTNLTGMKNVATVILNRIANPSFEKDYDVESTVFRDKQFSPVRDGNYGKAVVTEEVEKTVKEAVENYSYADNIVYGATHFANLSICNPKWQYKMEALFTDEAGHTFFR